jgi:hypothetical protein
MKGGIMPRSSRHWWFVCGLLGLALAGSARAADPLSAEQFDKLRAVIKPQASEDKWSEIPWLSSLWEARKRAAAEGKPILLWEMDGHPLGCV